MPEVVKFVPRIVSSSKPEVHPKHPELVLDKEAGEAAESDVVGTLEGALAVARGGEYSEVFIIVRDAETQEVDFMYSTTSDLQKLRLIRAADEWLASE